MGLFIVNIRERSNHINYNFRIHSSNLEDLGYYMKVHELRTWSLEIRDGSVLRLKSRVESQIYLCTSEFGNITFAII